MSRSRFILGTILLTALLSFPLWAQPAILIADGNHGAFTCSAGACTIDPLADIVTTAGTITLSRSDAGTVSVTAADDDATAQLNVYPGGAAAFQLGEDDTTQIDFKSDSDYNLINTSDNSVALHMRDYGSTDDDDMSHGIVQTNCTTTTTGAEDCDMTLSVATGGAAPSAAITIDADGNTASAAVNILLRAGADPPATCTLGEIFIDTDETDDTNCTTTADNSICICVATDTWASAE